jgi:threonine/homoserine/homoserine lactone efflux protein
MANLYPFLAYVVVTTFTPGPNNILAMSNAMRFGYKRTLGFLVGMFTGFFLVMLACGLLNVALVNRLPQVRFWLNLLGAGYMVYLAFHIMRSGAMEDSADKRDLNSFTVGFGLQFLNLKVILYGITVYAMFITPTFQNPATVSLFALVLAAIGFIAISCWALGGNIFRQTLRKHYRLFNLAMAGLLIYTAIAALLPHA